MYYIHIEETTMGAHDGGFSEAMSLCQNRFTPALYRNRQTTIPCIITHKGSERKVPWGDSQKLRQFAARTVLLFNMPFIAKVVLCSTKLTRWLFTIRDKQQKGLMVENKLWSKTVFFNLFMRSGQDCLQEWWSGHHWKPHYHHHHLLLLLHQHYHHH